MEKNFLFIDYNKRTIEGNDFICVFVLEFNTHQIFRIYKRYNKELMEKLANIKQFQNISNNISYVIKGQGKIALDIKI